MRGLSLPVLVLLAACLLTLGGCQYFAEQTAPMAPTGAAHRQEYFDALNRVPTHTGEDLPYHERAEIWSNNHH